MRWNILWIWVTSKNRRYFALLFRNSKSYAIICFLERLLTMCLTHEFPCSLSASPHCVELGGQSSPERHLSLAWHKGWDLYMEWFSPWGLWAAPHAFTPSEKGRLLQAVISPCAAWSPSPGATLARLSVAVSTRREKWHKKTALY